LLKSDYFYSIPIQTVFFILLAGPARTFRGCAYELSGACGIFSWSVKQRQSNQTIRLEPGREPLDYCWGVARRFGRFYHLDF